MNLGQFSTFFVKNRWPWHLVFWALHLLGRAFAYYVTVLYYSKEVLALMLVSELFFAALVYFTLWLYRHLRIGYLVLVGALIWTGFVALLAWVQVRFLGHIPEMAGLTWADSFFGNIKLYQFTFILLLLAKYFKDTFIQQWHEEEKSKLLIQSELKNLKAQISPHFLFNTMNNFYGLATTKSDKLPGLMVRLSDLLRYSLYETQSPTVPLHSEIAYLKDYIELEKLRLEDDLVFDFSTRIDGHSELQIVPLLLIVFVENAFKHGKNVQLTPMEIKMELSVDEHGKMDFDLRNSCVKKSTSTDAESGVGLENVRKRLEVFYPDDLHGLSIDHSTNVYRVSLKLDLNHRP